ncbi:MAG: hypothetical protein M1429_03230 [Patescibacteria group bacterium]|nr:hypothetical protein [Patescibacteria group bacterium]
MPEVTVKYNIGSFILYSKDAAQEIATEISNIVAEKLVCNGGHFTSEDVIVTFEQFGNWAKTNDHAAIVTIEADALPIPITDLKQRNKDIAKAIEILLKPKFRENSMVEVKIRLAPTVSTVFKT